MIRCWATTSPLSVAHTSNHCLSMTSSFPASDWLKKCMGRSCLRSSPLFIKGKKVALAPSVSPDPDSTTEEQEAAPLTVDATTMQAMRIWGKSTGSGGTRAQKWPLVWPRAMGDLEQKDGSQRSGRQGSLQVEQKGY